jgi:drug/metabolite transporter (DMT)-like permease
MSTRPWSGLAPSDSDVALGLTCALLAAGLYGVAAVLQASGARRVAWRAGLDPRILARMLCEPPVMVALVLLLVGFGLHLVAVRLLPLFLAQTGIAMSLVVSAVVAIARFGERLNRLEWGAIGVVVAGLVLLSASAGHIGDDGEAWLPAALLGAVVVIAVLAWPASRTRSTLSTAALGALAGFAYAVVGIAGRLLPGWTLDRIVGSVVTYVLILSGLVAFFLYTLALQRGAVTVATTPLIVAQTVAPSLVGLVLLGDTTRPGWSAAAALAFSLTVAAATALVRFEEAEALQHHRETSPHP